MLQLQNSTPSNVQELFLKIKEIAILAREHYDNGRYAQAHHYYEFFMDLVLEYLKAFLKGEIIDLTGFTPIEKKTMDLATQIQQARLAGEKEFAQKGSEKIEHFRKAQDICKKIPHQVLNLTASGNHEMILVEIPGYENGHGIEGHPELLIGVAGIVYRILDSELPPGYTMNVVKDEDSERFGDRYYLKLCWE